MKKIIKAIFIILLISASNKMFNISTSVNSVIAGSSSSGDIPPPGGQGEDTGGGSASGGLYLNYRIPLIFKTGLYAPSLISITALSVFQNETTVIFGFNSSIYSNNTATIRQNETLIIDPRDEPELTNGSLIQSQTPLQISVYHPSGNTSYDESFSYSVLVMQNWGRKYQAPFDRVNAQIIAGFNDTEITFYHNGTVQKETLNLVGDSLNLIVEKDTIIEANGPIGVIFYSLSQEEGSYAFTGIPFYLWGNEYYILPPTDMKDITSITAETNIVIGNIEEPGAIISTTSFQESDILFLTENLTTTLSTSELESGDFYHYIKADFVNFSINILNNYEINGSKHKSAVQYISASGMKWAEWFFTYQNYNNSQVKAISLDDENILVPLFISENQVSIDLANVSFENKGGYETYFAPTLYGVASINGSLFSIQRTIAPQDSVWNSATSLLYPLNLYSFVDNTSSSFPSWYRFPNINVKNVSISPKQPTELRNIKLGIIVQNNGSIPSAPFWVTVFVNDTLKINKKLDGIDINDTFTILYEEFQGFGTKTLNVSIYTDSQNQIFELIEFDNSFEIMIKIERNWNIIYVGIAVAVVILSYGIFLITRKIIQRSKEKRTQFDLILSEVEV